MYLELSSKNNSWCFIFCNMKLIMEIDKDPHT